MPQYRLTFVPSTFVAFQVVGTQKTDFQAKDDDCALQHVIHLMQTLKMVIPDYGIEKPNPKHLIELSNPLREVHVW